MSYEMTEDRASETRTGCYKKKHSEARYVSYLLLHDKLSPNYATYNKHLLSYTVSVGHESGRKLAAWSVSGSLMRLQSSCQLGLQFSEDLTGAGRSSFTRLIT